MLSLINIPILSLESLVLRSVRVILANGDASSQYNSNSF